MKASGYAAGIALAAALAWHGNAGGSGAAHSEEERSAEAKMPASSICMARCVEMERQCEALEKEFPACGTADICLGEKAQCEAQCRATAMLAPRPRS